MGWKRTGSSVDKKNILCARNQSVYKTSKPFLKQYSAEGISPPSRGRWEGIRAGLLLSGEPFCSSPSCKYQQPRGQMNARGVSVLLLGAMLTVSRGEGEEACETLPSEIHIIKEEFDELGRLQRTCNGDVAVNKCEGACNSQVQPSVITPTGFLKECYCCRESFLRERVLTLTHCYDPDGMRLTSQAQASMEVKLREPADCKCYKCGDYSR